MRRAMIVIVLLLLIGVANGFFSSAAGPMDDAKEAIALSAKCGPNLRVSCLYQSHVEIAAVILHYLDFAIAVAIVCFAISTCLKMRYGNYYVPFYLRYLVLAAAGGNVHCRIFRCTCYQLLHGGSKEALFFRF